MHHQAFAQGKGSKRFLKGSIYKASAWVETGRSYKDAPRAGQPQTEDGKQEPRPILT